MRILGRVYAPVSQALRFTSDAVGVATNTTRNLVQRTLRAVNGLGRAAVTRTDKAVTNMTRRKRQQRRNTRKQERRRR
jgi:hypothetical protein